MYDYIKDAYFFEISNRSVTFLYNGTFCLSLLSFDIEKESLLTSSLLTTAIFYSIVITETGQSSHASCAVFSASVGIAST